MLGLKDFIVWDKSHNQFLNVDYIKGIAFDNGKLHYIATSRKPKGLHSDLFNEEIEFLYDIGLKDINSKKIYADCSIVELDFQGHPIMVKLQGYFSFDTQCLMYVIKLLPADGLERLMYCANEHKISNIKIIDTIQENKLGLIK